VSDLRLARWLGTSYVDARALPRDVYAIAIAMMNGTLDAADAPTPLDDEPQEG
jgi:hypothetical protein